MASGISTTQASSAYRSARSTGRRRRPQTSSASTARVLAADQAHAGRTGPVPPPRNNGTAIPAPAVSTTHRPASRASPSAPDSSASSHPAQLSPTPRTRSPTPRRPPPHGEHPPPAPPARGGAPTPHPPTHRVGPPRGPPPPRQPPRHRGRRPRRHRGPQRPPRGAGGQQ